MSIIEVRMRDKLEIVKVNRRNLEFDGGVKQMGNDVYRNCVMLLVGAH